MLEQSGLQAVALWAGLHLATTLVLALNVVRRRLGQDPDPDGPLHKAVRAHGNNIEYVPIILLGQVVLALLGTNTVVIHAALAVFGWPGCAMPGAYSSRRRPTPRVSSAIWSPGPLCC